MIVQAETNSNDADGVEITAVSKLKHASLWRAVKKMGSQRKLAKYLGVDDTQLSKWVRLKSCPPSKPSGGKWTADFIAAVEAKLFALTGLNWEETFPKELRESISALALIQQKETTRLISQEDICKYAIENTGRMERIANDDGRDRLEEAEASQAIDNAIVQQLDFREGDIIKLRYGLGDGYSYTLEEVAHKLGITKERVRQIETRAMLKLQRPGCSEKLLAHTGW